MRKRILSLVACGVLAAASVAGMAACTPSEEGGGGGGGGTVELTVWGPQAQQDTIKEMVELFKQANPDTTYDIEVGVCSEADAYANVSKDPSAAADVYAYANDQIVNLVRVGGLARVGGSNAEAVENDNGEGAVAAATFQGNLYGYPYAADNGYFMYYDKSVVSEEQAQTLEGIIEACEAAGKRIAWPLDDSWYVAGMFFTFDCGYEVTYDAATGAESSITCTFNNAGGIKASKAMKKLTESSSFAGKGTNNDTIIAGFNDGTTAVAVTGTWNATAIEDALGENYAACKLPTVTVDGETKQISSFAGYKIYGVNPTSDNLSEAHKLAAFLASEDMQELRFKEHAIGPTNKVVAASDEVAANVALAALSDQNQYAVAQTAVPTNFWDPVRGYGLAIIDGLAESEFQAQLDQMVSLIVNTAQ